MSTDIKSSAVITTTALDADGLSTAAAVGNNAALTLGGALTSGGAYTADTGTARQITLLSAGDDSGKTFTVVGTDVNGDALSETVTGANAGTATSTGYFATISSITAVGNPAGNMSAGINSEVAGVIFQGPTRVKNLIWSGGGAIGTINIRNSGTAGTSLIAVRSDATLGVNDHLSLAKDGVLFASGAYITYTETQCNSVTAFYG
jgi:hypothetical protein